MRLAFLLSLGLLVPPARASILVVRHAERADAKDDASLLSSKGKRRAQRLRDLLAAVELKAVYTTEYGRTQQTGAPTAEARGLKLTVTDSEKAGALAAELKAVPAAENALVVGHTDTIPDILKGLGVTEPVAVADGDYDNLFIVTPRVAAPPLLLRLKY